MTLAIAAVVAAFAVPSMQNILGGSALSAASNDLVYGLQTARSEAIKRTTPVHLCPSKNPTALAAACGGNYSDGWIVYVDTDSDGSLSANESVILRNDALSPAFTVAADPLFGQRVMFSLSGTSVNSAGIPIGGNLTLTHSSKSERHVVSIAANGRISTLLDEAGAGVASLVVTGGSS